MSLVRQQYRVPRLRQITKRVIRGCYGCKKFQVTAFSNPPAGKPRTDRTEGLAPFQVVGLDFIGPIGYKFKTEKEFTLPRLELISTHKAANLVDNIGGALKGYVVKSVYG